MVILTLPFHHMSTQSYYLSLQLVTMPALQVNKDRGYAWVILAAGFLLSVIKSSNAMVGIMLVEMSHYYNVPMVTITLIGALQTGVGQTCGKYHDDVIKWNPFPRYWPFVRGIHRSPVNSPHKGQWRGALMFSLICAWINDWVNNREAGDLRRHLGHYDVNVVYSHADVMACKRFSH